MKLKKSKKLLLYILNTPLYWISKLIPKDENIWIFGAWFGEKYADNSKYLFEYVNKNHPEIRAIWLTTNKSTLDLIESKGYETYLTYSLKSYYFSAKAVFSFVSTDFIDVNSFISSKYIINLWHGNPLKKVVYDDRINATNKLSMKRKILKLLFPFSKDAFEFKYIVASSEDEAKNLSTAFLANLNQILITGLPRNDVFFNNKVIDKSKVKVIYMPTHRSEGELNIAELFIHKIEKINTILNIHNIELYIKLHFYHMKNMNIQSYSNVKIVLDSDIQQDVYSIMNDFDILLTDYSSIFFDFLLADRSIIFAPFDYEKYITQDREFYYDYDEVTPGPKCKNWDEVLEWIIKFKENPELYKEEREAVKNRFHKYQDGRSCERVYNEIINLREKV